MRLFFPNNSIDSVFFRRLPKKIRANCWFRQYLMNIPARCSLHTIKRSDFEHNPRCLAIPVCTPLEPLRRVHDSSCSARLLEANVSSIVKIGYSAVCGGISLTCGAMLKRFTSIYGVIDENAFHGKLMRCPYINYSRDKGKRLRRYWRQCIPPQVNEIPPGKNSLRALVIV